MSNVDTMRGLCEEIVASYDARTAAVQDIVKETAETLQAFRTDHQQMSAELRSALVQGELERKKSVRAMLSAFEADRKGMAEAWRDTVDALRTRRAGAQ